MTAMESLELVLRPTGESTPDSCSSLPDDHPDRHLSIDCDHAAQILYATRKLQSLTDEPQTEIPDWLLYSVCTNAGTFDLR